MTGFIRPELRAALFQWRESLIGLAVLALGLWWALTGLGPLALLGWALIIGGTALGLTGAQRARFRTGQGGPGVVAIDEGQLSYFGPLEGGVIDVENLRLLELEPNALPAAHWVLTDITGTRLHIPTNAEGVEALFDVFAALPGIRTEAMLAQLTHAPDQRVTIWERERPQIH